MCFFWCYFMFYYHVKLALSYDYALLPDYGRIPNRKWRRNCFFTLYRFLPISELSAWNKIKNDFPIMNVNLFIFQCIFCMTTRTCISTHAYAVGCHQIDIELPYHVFFTHARESDIELADNWFYWSWSDESTFFKDF